MPTTHYGPITLKECNEDIALYLRMMKNKPDSADIFQQYIAEINEIKSQLLAGKVFDQESQTFITPTRDD